VDSLPQSGRRPTIDEARVRESPPAEDRRCNH